jgi:hypothetical protein
MPPQTVVLFATPKIISDFSSPAADVARFLDHYLPLTSRAAETIVIFAVGNSEHIPEYRGKDFWDDEVEWARHTGFRIPVSDRALDYNQIEGILRAFRSHAAAQALNFKLFDQVDQTREMAYTDFRDNRHPECLARDYGDAFDIGVGMRADHFMCASAPNGFEAGTLCGRFLADQVAHYLDDLGFDGILYGNQLGTRGRWLPENEPGYSEEEATVIHDFLEYSRLVLGDKELMWFDSYNNVTVERESFSFPSDGYRFFDYLMASEFAVITFTERYVDNLESKLLLNDRPRVLATLDYVDPWYAYNSMTEYAAESARLEQIAIAFRH